MIIILHKLIIDVILIEFKGLLVQFINCLIIDDNNNNI